MIQPIHHKTCLAAGAALAVSLCVHAGATLDYARDEAKRLMARAGARAEVVVSEKPCALFLTPAGAEKASAPSVSDVRDDGYAIAAKGGGCAVAATCEKGVLNGLYALAERLGFAFLLPGEAGERIPARLNRLPDGTVTENPRFKYRGVFMSSGNVRFTERESYAFFAKLRFNAMCAHISGDSVGGDDFAKTLGLRLEIGGHGMSACLPRELYEKEPELFRMFQPEDFGGKRLKDSNFCATNPKTRDIVKANFRKKLEGPAKRGYHAVHGWADDLPGGGWCMCSRCRALSGTDQSQLAMNLEAEAVRELGADMRVPAIAYHDTMFPSETIRPDPLCFLLFAPRERCYAHAINDPTCALNRHYLAALAAWTAAYRGIDDSHTFEYYNDKILFRGHAPYLPDVILGDADAYEKAGIESWMSLHVGGNFVAPDFNMLAHAAAAWDRSLTRAQLTRRLALAAGGADADAWADYLDARATAYETAWRVCDVPSAIYFDYRFMPERPSDRGGRALVANLTRGEATLAAAVGKLAASAAKTDAFSRAMADQVVRYDRFAAKDLAAMVAHQKGLTAIADRWNGADAATLTAGLDDLRRAIALLKEARALYAEAAKGFEKNQYYFGFVDNWIGPEIENKIRVYSAR